MRIAGEKMKMEKGIKDIRSLLGGRNPEEIYPDIAVWQLIPLNRITERLWDKDLNKPEEALEESCKDELSEYLWTVFKSIERNTSSLIHSFDDEMHAELLEHFWEAKKLPSPRGVLELYSSKRRPMDLEATIYSE